MSAIAEVRRIFGDAVARIDDALRLLVLAQLQIGIGEEVKRVVARGVRGWIGGGLWIDPRRVGQRHLVGRAIRADHLLP